MSREQKLSTMSVEEYLKFEENSNVRHEYLNGQIFAMTGGTIGHNQISLNIASTLKSQLKGSSCKVCMADVKVRVSAENAFYYPDVFVDCGTHKTKDVFVEAPVVIFEVSSPSTAAIDQREKLVAYQQLSSLKAYVIVRQSRKHIIVYRRVSPDSWTVQELTLSDEFVIEICAGTTISLKADDIYEDTSISGDLTIKEEDELYVW